MSNVITFPARKIYDDPEMTAEEIDRRRMTAAIDMIALLEQRLEEQRIIVSLVRDLQKIRAPIVRPLGDRQHDDGFATAK